MIKNHPKVLAIEIAERSTCRVKVGAVIVDKKGIFSWGWNSMGGTGFGMCAEQHAISRANPKRLKGATIYVFGRHRKTNNYCPAKPCITCQISIYQVGITKVWWMNKFGWEKYDV